MKYLVIGSGLMGLTTAYYLRCRGHQVTVIDREPEAGRGASFANGALLTPSMPEPWNAPGCWRVLLSSLVGANAPLQLRLRAVPRLAGWGIRFLCNARTAHFRRNTRSNLRLAQYSVDALAALRRELRLEYDQRMSGTLRVFRDKAALNRARIAAEELVPAGLHYRMLSIRETLELEPGLAPVAEGLRGALYYPDDELGDAYKFCVALSRHAQRQGVEFRFETQVTRLEMRSEIVTAAFSAAERFVADRYVVAAGSYSAPLVRSVGLRLPVQPAKGYSITIPCDESRRALSVPVVDDEWHAAIAPVGFSIRVAGTAEFAGYDLTVNSRRTDNLMRLLRRVLPSSKLDFTQAKAWCGLRPMCVDGVPIIGATPIPNLFLNTGHGHLGWTMAAGSGKLLAGLLSDERATIDSARYELKRFAY